LGAEGKYGFHKKSKGGETEKGRVERKGFPRPARGEKTTDRNKKKKKSTKKKKKR